MPRQSSSPKASTSATAPAAPGARPTAGHQRLEVLGEHHRAERDGAAGGDPVGPADHEAGVLAEPAADDDVLPARIAASIAPGSASESVASSA